MKSALPGTLLQGFETSALDTELTVAFGEALPGLPGMEPPLSGEQFASLRLATPLHVPAIEPPEHDLALPGELPPLGGSMPANVSFTGEMELIIPDDDADFSPRQPASAERDADADVIAPAVRGGGAASSSRGKDPSSDIDLPMLDVDLGEPEIRRSGAMSRADFDRIPLVSGAELLDMPDEAADSDTASDRDAALPAAERGVDGTPTDVDPIEFVAQAMDESADDSSGDSSSTAAGVVEQDEGIELPAWMDESSSVPTAAANAAPPARGPRRSSGAAAPSKSDASAPPADVAPRQTQSRLSRATDSLRVRVEASPTDWALRHQLAEALFEGGDRDGGLRELEVAMIGLERGQDLDGARSMADEIIRLNPNSVRHHQKRVEYAFRTNDRSRLPEAYLELADALFRSGQADKARAVYHRVLELAPQDPRAQAALSTFGDLPLDPAPAPPPPARKAGSPAPRSSRSSAPRLRSSGPRRATRDADAAAASGPSTTSGAKSPGDADRFVNLGDWLRDDEAPKSTRSGG